MRFLPAQKGTAKAREPGGPTRKKVKKIEANIFIGRADLLPNRKWGRFALGFSLMAVHFFLFAPSQADFDDLGAGARAVGMGNAFVGLADDSNAVYFNPAGLGFINRAQIGVDYSRLHTGLSDKSRLGLGFISYVQPLGKVREFHYWKKTSTGTVKSSTTVQVPQVSTATKISQSAPSAQSLQKGERSQMRLARYGTAGFALRSFSLTDALQERTLYLSYGRLLNRRLAVGGTFKYLTQEYEQDAYTRIDPVFEFGKRNSLSAVSGDLGVLWNIRARFYFGLSVMDLIRPDVGLLDSEKLPSTYRMGLGFKERLSAGALDFVVRDGRWRFGSGVERWVSKNRLGLRIGAILGEEDLFDASLGFSFRFSLMQVDYGFLFPLGGIEETAGTHRLSLVYRFGRPQLNELEVGSLEYSYWELAEKKVSLEKELSQTKAQKEELERVLVEDATRRIRERVARAQIRGKTRNRASVKAAGESNVPGLGGFITHYTRRGDTLRKLAKTYYGDARQWKDIYNANRGKVGLGGRLKKGSVILVPRKGASRLSRKKLNEASRKTLPAKETRKVLSGARQKKAVVLSGKKVSRSGVAAKGPRSVTKTKGRKSGSHSVKDGETLKTIAKEHYGDSRRWVDIYKANRGKVSRGNVEPGTVLKIP